ncbi:MAG TPA: GAF domain-containing protein [Neobacillus sp.]|jgi:signal transduction protein with GAF and PtsI domain
MTEIREVQQVIDVCNQLMNRVDVEFVGLAIQNEIGPDIMWHYALGNLNDKYKRITVRFGKGIAGKVISSGSSIQIIDFPNDILGKVTDYPIMLAEKLLAAYAVPLFFNHVPKGVLLVGNRSKKLFSEDEQEKVNDSAQFLEQVLKGHIRL